MLKKLRISIICILVLALVFSITACSDSKKDENNGSSSQSNPLPEDLAGNITLSGYSNYDSDNDLFLFAQEFAFHYPSVDVKIDNGYTYDEYIESLDERIMNGDIGDVILMPSSKIPEYVEKGWIVDLSDDAYGVIDYTSTSYKKLYPSDIFMKAAYEASMYEGRFYMCPVEYLNQAVILNLDLLEKAGIENPVPADNWTWDDLLTYAKALSDSGVKTPVLMNYSQYRIWGAFASAFGGTLYNDIDFASKPNELSFTDPYVIQGLQYLVDNFISTGYASDLETADVTAEELSNYGIIVAEHSDLVRWESALTKSSDEGGFDWELAHFPGFVDENGNVFKNIGVETLGFAVINHEVVDALNGEDNDIELSEEELEEQKAAMESLLKNAKTLALYAMVEDAAVSYCGERGYKVPALISANTRKFWREYPVSGKNTSVFSLYSEYDYPASLTSFMTWNASNEIRDSISDILKACAENPGSADIEDLLQEIQDAANASS